MGYKEDESKLEEYASSGTITGQVNLIGTLFLEGVELYKEGCYFRIYNRHAHVSIIFPLTLIENYSMIMERKMSQWVLDKETKEPISLLLDDGLRGGEFKKRGKKYIFHDRGKNFTIEFPIEAVSSVK